jgi:hypothetical protein
MPLLRLALDHEVSPFLTFDLEAHLHLLHPR